MLALIKREIEDNVALFLIAAIMATILVPTIVYFEADRQARIDSPRGVSRDMFEILMVLLPVLLSFFAAAMGATQMYSDRSKKISTFLSTLVTTRSRILAARIIAGVLAILVALLPIAFTAVILLRLYNVQPASSIYIRFFTRFFLTTFLSVLACYCLGLQFGWSTNKFLPIFGVIVLSPVLISVVVIKGLGLHTLVLMSLFIVASLIRVWQKFTSTSL